MNYMVKPLGYVLLIVLGYGLKRAGFFGREDYRLMSRIMINITLPCTIVRAFSGFSRDPQMFLIVGISFVCSMLPPILMYLATPGVDTRLRAYRMINIGGYNIGCFSLPLIEAFFGSTGVVAACMFDVGNAVMMTGGAYALTSTLLSMFREVVFGVGFALLLPLFFGLDGVLYSMPVSDVLTFCISTAIIVKTYRELREEGTPIVKQTA